MPLWQYCGAFGRLDNLLHGADDSFIIPVRILQKDIQRCFGRNRGTIRAWCNTRTENIAGPENTRRQRDIAALKALRVAGAIETFVYLK